MTANMIYAILVLFRKHQRKFPTQDQFSNANRITFLKRKVRQVSSEKSVVAMNVEKEKSKTILSTITVMIATTIFAWTAQLPQQKY